MRASELAVKHWSEVIADRVVREKKEPFVIASGITTSGPVHLGTVCEFLYPSALDTYLKDAGYRTRFIFIGDVMDAFDSVPADLERFDRLAGELGKPLCRTLDPFGCCPSYGEHFLNQTIEVMEGLDVHPEIFRSDELYERGLYDDYARLFIRRISEVKRILEGVSMRRLPQGWLDIVLPVCGNCGKIATTRVLGFQGEDVVHYACDKDVGYAKGCGYRGETALADHEYKLMWRLDWPSRQDFFNVSVEGAGVDHHTRGGSWDTAVAIHREIFGKEPPVGFMYGFLLYKGKKYSKSKGLGIGVQELLDLIPPEVAKFLLFKPDVSENKEFDPTSWKLIRLFEEYEEAANLSERKGRLTRAQSKAVLAYRLSTKERKWRSAFLDVLVNYQILRDWEAVVRKLGDPGIRYLKPYVESWIRMGYVPDEYSFTFSPKNVGRFQREIVDFAERLDESMDALEVHNLVYEVASRAGIDAPELFKALYTSLIGKDRGPRFGRLVVAIGVRKVKESLLSAYASGREKSRS